MNKKKVQKLIESVVFETLVEFRSSFRWEDLKKIQDPLERIKYAAANLPLLGHGSSRVAFALPNTKYVLKLARNDKGFAQNQQEVEVFTSPTSQPVIAKIFDSADDYSWLTSETVKEFPDSEQGMNQFYQTTGLNFSLLSKILGLIGDYKQGWRENLGQAFARNSQIFQNIQKNYLNHPFVKALESLMLNEGLAAGDLSKVEHYGRTADGRVVLLDYGLTKEVWKKHYEKPQQDMKAQMQPPGETPEQQMATAPKKRGARQPIINNQNNNPQGQPPQNQ
jgi:hypothetical protein